MRGLCMIACVSQDRGLGYKGELLWNLPEDMKFFRQTTTGHPVVMGSKTFQSIGRPLPKRENIVLSRGEIDADVTVFHDKVELDKYLETLDGDKFIIGGASLYSMYLDQAETLYLTEVEGEKPADTFFPKFDTGKYDREVIKTCVSDLDQTEFNIVKYTKRALGNEAE